MTHCRHCRGLLRDEGDTVVHLNGEYGCPGRPGSFAALNMPRERD